MPAQMNVDVDIRVATQADAAVLAALCRQLGRDIPVEVARAHLKDGQGQRCILLGSTAREGAVGFVEVAARTSLSAGAWAEVLGLVVEERHRRRRIATALVQAARRWARDNGLKRLRARTKREEAASFYAEAGFRLTKQQNVFDAAL